MKKKETRKERNISVTQYSRPNDCTLMYNTYKKTFFIYKKILHNLKLLNAKH